MAWGTLQRRRRLRPLNAPLRRSRESSFCAPRLAGRVRSQRAICVHDSLARLGLRAKNPAVAYGHHHNHHHDHLPPGPELDAPAVRRLLGGVVAVLLAAALVGLAVWWPRGDPVIDREVLGFGDRVNATVTAAEVGPCSYDPEAECNSASARIDSGPDEGSFATLEADVATRNQVSELDAGDDIVLNDAGPDVDAAARYSFADIQRRMPLVILALVFGVAVVALGRLRGLLALVGIGITVAVLLGFVFPALLRGASPLGVALTGAIVIAVSTIYLAHGVSDRTTVALVGTIASLGLTAALGAGFGAAAHLSGLASDESLNLLAFAPELDFRGLLLAATILGALGVLDDVTITQVSAVWELHDSDPRVGARQLYTAGIRIGRDHIASTVNTLVLAYTAAALPTLLLFTQSGLAVGEVLTTETLAVEIVQTLVGSIGLVASVPLTTALASWVVTLAGREQQPEHFGLPSRRPAPADTQRDTFWGPQ
jgi:uncharacterized membrane protein